jgi:hypothetical protein
VFKPLADAIRTIAADTTTRKILIFLVLNLSFCGVEALYGLITNSLGLFTDAIHMGFDSTAIAMGLAASVIGKWQKDERWSFGCVSFLEAAILFVYETRDEVHVGRHASRMIFLARPKVILSARGCLGLSGMLFLEILL